MGMKDFLQSNFRRRRPPTHPAVVAVNVPQAVEEEEAAPSLQRSLGPKVAEGEEGPPGLLDVATRAMTGPPATTPGPGIGDFLSGRMSANVGSKPWFWPAALTAGAGGIVGGYKGMDYLLGGIKKKEREQELERAKEEYRKALIEQYSPESIKQGAVQDELGRDLTELYQLHKEAGGVTDALGTATGGYLALAAALAGGTGLATYNWAKARSPEDRLAKAIKQRERLRWATRPPEIYAVTRPAPVRMQSQAQEDTFAPGSEADQETVRKYAQEVAAWYKS
jgi:hypothetical protein